MVHLEEPYVWGRTYSQIKGAQHARRKHCRKLHKT